MIGVRWRDPATGRVLGELTDRMGRFLGRAFVDPVDGSVSHPALADPGLGEAWFILRPVEVNYLQPNVWRDGGSIRWAWPPDPEPGMQPGWRRTRGVLWFGLY